MNTWHPTREETPLTKKVGGHTSCKVSDWVIGRYPRVDTEGDLFSICRYWEDGSLNGWEVYTFDWNDFDRILAPEAWYDFEFRRDV